MTGSHEVRGSIPLGSTNPLKSTYSDNRRSLSFSCGRSALKRKAHLLLLSPLDAFVKDQTVMIH
jgi:hypothetical protein